MVWTHIILEAYCARKWSTTRSKYLYKRLKNGSFEKVENKNYDSNYRTPRKPGYCENTPNYACLEKKLPALGLRERRGTRLQAPRQKVQKTA
ncbi:hypothetical protein COU39_01545 [Candidatus Micrarchaeota archaeon CG10_big_fil_rev_8_21_14_0_10_60_32]|nr:MAG: hypothetical protein COU39_01545 [Candidatus Micrarchaeota archaeon CG10_big_fil_rev_8_21_14_0_10_60_32]